MSMMETHSATGHGLKSRLQRAGRQFVKYCLVGATGMVLNLAVYAFMLKVAGSHYMACATVSFTVAATNNFLLNKYWTFGNPAGAVFYQMSRFIIVSVSSLGLNLALLTLLLEELQVGNRIIAQAIAISLVTVFNFTGNKMWSFRRPTA